MGGKALDVGSLSGRSHNVPDSFGCDSIAPDLSRPTYSPEDRATVDAGRRAPLIDGAFLLHRNWNGADVFSFATQVRTSTLLNNALLSAHFRLTDKPGADRNM
jgi:hypothetical protein